eukprot:6202806-Pleurochrysis_carterae.AAC.1
MYEQVGARGPTQVHRRRQRSGQTDLARTLTVSSSLSSIFSEFVNLVHLLASILAKKFCMWAPAQRCSGPAGKRT